MTEGPSSEAQETHNLYSPAHRTLQLAGPSFSKDWLADMIFDAKALGTGAEFVGLPFVRATFGTVVICLETVDVRLNQCYCFFC